jgi:hypothetical protein
LPVSPTIAFSVCATDRLEDCRAGLLSEKRSVMADQNQLWIGCACPPVSSGMLTESAPHVMKINRTGAVDNAQRESPHQIARTH